MIVAFAPTYVSYIPHDYRNCVRYLVTIVLRLLCTCITCHVSHLRVADDGRVKPDYVISGLHHVPPPRVLDVFLQLHPERPVVEEPREPVVNLSMPCHVVSCRVMSYRSKKSCNDPNGIARSVCSSCLSYSQAYDTFLYSQSYLWCLPSRTR